MADPPALAEFLAACTLPEFEIGDYYLARLDPGAARSSITEPAIVVQPGYYDDWDPAIVYQGAWTKEPAHGSGPRHLDPYAATPGAAGVAGVRGTRRSITFTRRVRTRDRIGDHRRRGAGADRHVRALVRVAAQRGLLLFRPGTARDRDPFDRGKESGVERTRARSRLVLGGRLAAKTGSGSCPAAIAGRRVCRIGARPLPGLPVPSIIFSIEMDCPKTGLFM